MSNDYFRGVLTPVQIARARHHFFVKPKPPYTDPPRRVLCELKPEQLARVARNKAFVCEHLPELVPMIKELHEAGMIDGWRGVVEVKLLKGMDHESKPA